MTFFPVFRRSPVRSGRRHWAPRLEVLEGRTLPSVTVGLAQSGLSNTQYYPPDTVGAVGPNHYVEAVNTQLGYYNKSNGSQVQVQALQTFFSGLGGVLNLSDPFVTYDTYAGKFVVGVLDFANNYNPSRLDFAVSNDSSPLDGWSLHRYDMTRDSVGGPYLNDYPRFGYNSDAYVISCNMFLNGASFSHVDTLSISKSTMQGYQYAWPTGTVSFPGMTPTVIHDGAIGGPMWLAASAGQTGGSAIKVIKMTNELSSSPTIQSYSVSVSSYSSMPAPHQPGGSNMNWTFDTRMLNAAMINGDLVTADNTGSGGFARARWYEFNTNATPPTLIQSGSIAPASTDTYFPTMEITGSGTIGMTYIESSTSEYMSTYVTGRTPADSQGTMETGVSPSALHGTSRYTIPRAGDYSGINVDPNDGETFWAANEFKAGGTYYNTGFASFSLGTVSGATHFSVVPDTNPATAGSEFQVTVSALDASGNVYPGYVGTVHFTSSDSQASLPDDYTFTASDNGVHIFPVTLFTAGNQDVTATDANSGSITGSASITVNPAALDHFSLSILAFNPQTAGRPFNVTVTAKDAYENTITDYQGTVTFSSGDPYGATLPQDYTFSSGDRGSHVFGGVTLYTAGTWDVTVTDVAMGISNSGYVNVQAAPAVAFQILAPSPVTSGVPFDVTVMAQDPYGNTDTNYRGTITWSTTDPDPGVVLPPDYQFQAGDQGQVTFPGGVTLITPGNQTLTVTDTSSGINGNAIVTVNSGTLAALGTSPSRSAPALPAAPANQAPAPTRASRANVVVDQVFLGSSSGGVLSVQTSDAAPVPALDPSGGLFSGILLTDLTQDPLLA